METLAHMRGTTVAVLLAEMARCDEENRRLGKQDLRHVVCRGNAGALEAKRHGGDRTAQIMPFHSLTKTQVGRIIARKEAAEEADRRVMLQNM